MEKLSNIQATGEAVLPGFPSWYTTVNQLFSIAKWISLAVIVILLIICITKKVKKQPTHKAIIITGIIAIVIFILSMVVRLPYYS